ncbi:MAG: T9SS type A sorting domain-containing protein [Bacteroidia bacterium]|jgi:hypothetical protein|nr:T9SS type A sorting domain-containing protein [Bacteroidia bacterium]
MKKLIFTFVGAITLTSLMAQSNLNLKTEKFRVDHSASAPMHTNFSKAEVSDWYFPQDWSGIPANSETFVSFLISDSAKFINTDGVASYPSRAAIAQVLDPKDDGIDLSENPGIKLTRFSNYKVDSVWLRYLYIRRVDSILDPNTANYNKVVDTLFVTYFRGAQINTTGSFAGEGQNTRFGMVGWSFPTQFPANFTQTDTILLADNTLATTVSNDGWQLANLILGAPASMTVNSTGSLTNNLVAYSVRFKPGMAFDSTFVMEDRRDSANIPQDTKFVNYFGYQFASTAVNVPNTTFFNTSLAVPARFAFRSFNGWQGWYPGYGFDEFQYHTMGFRLTSGNVGLKDNASSSFGMSNVYPNPANVNSKAAVLLNLKQSSTVTLSIYNIAGQLVGAVASKTVPAGELPVEIDLSGLKAGVYLVNINVNGESQTKRLTIAE